MPQVASTDEALTVAMWLLEARDKVPEELRAEIQKDEASRYREIADLDAFFDRITAEPDA